MDGVRSSASAAVEDGAGVGKLFHIVIDVIDVELLGPCVCEVGCAEWWYFLMKRRFNRPIDNLCRFYSQVDVLVE